MTPEEAIKEFQSELKWAELNTYPYVSKQKVEADKMAIRALKQEPTQMIDKSNFSQEQYKTDLQSAYDCGKSVLDKIKEEIREHADRLKDSLYGDGLRHALEIIDKYKEIEE